MITKLFTNPIEFLGWLLAVIIAIMAHEVAHGYIALKNGDPTAKYMGRLNFDITKHFDLMGSLMFLVIGIGYAKPVPIDPRNFKNMRKGYFQVSIAGVATNFILAFIAFPIYFLASIHLPDMLMFDDFLRYFLVNFFIINIWLMVFNLLPLYPLDGFRLVELFSKPQNKFVVFMRNNARYVFLGYLLFSYLLPQYSPVSFIGNYVMSGIQWVWSFVLW